VLHGKRIASIIGARAGSKGLPGKSLLDLGGRPVIAWTIEAARGSRYLDRVVVSTDSPAIAAAARAAGADAPFLRPEELANDTCSIEAVVAHALATLRRDGDLGRFDYVVLLHPTIPFRTPAQIDTCLERYFESSPTPVDTLVSVASAPDKIGWLLSSRDGRHVHFAFDVGTDLRRQALPSYYLPNGVFYVAPADPFPGRFYADATRFVVLDDPDLVDLDTPDDLDRARAVLARRRRAPAPAPDLVSP